MHRHKIILIAALLNTIYDATAAPLNVTTTAASQPTPPTTKTPPLPSTPIITTMLSLANSTKASSPVLPIDSKAAAFSTKTPAKRLSNFRVFSKYDIGLSTIATTAANNRSFLNVISYNNSKNGSRNATKSEETDEKSRFYFVIIIGSISLTTLLVNFTLLVTFCVRHDASVIDSFGFSLMFFNILLAMYGAAMAVYLSQYQTEWNQQFCQGFTSIKLFAMGASVWTLILLTYHHSIKTSTTEERDAIFKSIVYILEGLMLSGVFAVMAWIKIDEWDYLCVIFKPDTTVEWLLTGIELWYFFMAFVLIVRYPIHELRKKKKTIDKKHLNPNFPIFLMVLVCFLFWVSGYVITLPWYDHLFSWYELNAVIRVCTVVFPHILQPLIYAIRNTCCCICDRSPCSKRKELGIDQSIILQCDCDDDGTCPACLADSDVRYENTMFLDRYESEANCGKQTNRRKARIVRDIDEAKSNDNKKGGNFTPSKAVPRSPLLKTSHHHTAGDESEETPLIGKEEEELQTTSKVEKKVTPNTLALPTDNTPLLDDTDGGGKNPPKAMLDKSTLNSPAEFPSFITMENAVDVDALPRPKTSPKLKPIPATKENEEGRKSRGPTFYPLDEEIKSAGEPQKKTKRKSKNRALKDIAEKTNDESCNKNSNGNSTKPPPKRKKKHKKQSSIDSSGSRTPIHASQRNSTVSLEWDHSYSYSDSSGSSSGRGSDLFPDETVIITSGVKPTSPILENGGIKHSPIHHQQNDKSSEKEHTMEWDPSACQFKQSPKTDSNATSNNTKDMNVVELKNKNNINKSKSDEKHHSNANGKATPMVNNKTQPP